MVAGQISGTGQGPRIALAALLAAGFGLQGCAASRSPRSYISPIFRTPRPPLAERPQRPTVAVPHRGPNAPDPNWMPTQGIRRQWTDIVIHHSGSDAGSAASFDRYHRDVNRWDELGYHFVIGNGTETSDGYVEVGPRWQKQKWGAHCKTPGNHYNNHGVGICLVGDFSRSKPSRAQLDSLDRLLRFLTERCHIPVNHIQGHGSITGRTECPGRQFPLASVKRDLGMAPGLLSHASASAGLH
jgi:hypothetical protein